MKEQFDIMIHKQRQNRPYWLAWARERGAHYYSQREPGESAEYLAPCVSSEPWLQAAFVEGWKEAAAA